MDIKREKINKVNKMTVFSVILFVLVVIWLTVSVNNAGEAAEKNRADSVYRAVMNSVLLCYSIEGEYPPDMEYLEKNYGVRADDDKYIIHYEYFGANIRPSLTVTERNSERTVYFEDEQS